MTNNTSKSEVFSWKKVECLLRIGNEILPQVEEYLRVLFTCEVRIRWAIDRLISSASVVMRTLHQVVVENTELSQKAKLVIYQSIFLVPTLTYSHQLLGSD